MKIGLVGEAPNDTQSIQYLLEKKYPYLNFHYLLNRINGSQLDSNTTKIILRKENEFEKLDLIIFIRDLDGFSNNKHQLKIRKDYFTKSNKTVDKKGIYLLHIYEIEALILADIETFNKLYNCDISKIKNPTEITEPKELLKSFSKEYNESDNPEIFKHISFEKAKNCDYFEQFIIKFDKKLNQ